MGTQLRRGASGARDDERIDALVLRIVRLIRHRGFDRTKVVSAILTKYLPTDAGYDWHGEAILRARLVKAALDGTTIEHLIASARMEVAMIRDRNAL